jgi:hypothetical protein
MAEEGARAALQRARGQLRYLTRPASARPFPPPEPGTSAHPSCGPSPGSQEPGARPRPTHLPGAPNLRTPGPATAARARGLENRPPPHPVLTAVQGPATGSAGDTERRAASDAGAHALRPDPARGPPTSSSWKPGNRARHGCAGPLLLQGSVRPALRDSRVVTEATSVAAPVQPAKRSSAGQSRESAAGGPSRGSRRSQGAGGGGCKRTAQRRLAGSRLGSGRPWAGGIHRVRVPPGHPRPDARESAGSPRPARSLRPAAPRLFSPRPREGTSASLPSPRSPQSLEVWPRLPAVGRFLPSELSGFLVVKNLVSPVAAEESDLSGAHACGGPLPSGKDGPCPTPGHDPRRAPQTHRMRSGPGARAPASPPHLPASVPTLPPCAPQLIPRPECPDGQGCCEPEFPTVDSYLQQTGLSYQNRTNFNNNVK